MKRVDLRVYIIPTKIGNTDEHHNTGNNAFDTVDLIFLDSYDNQYDGIQTDEERRVSSTDYARMNNCYTYSDYDTRTGKSTTYVWLRSAYGRYFVRAVNGDGDWLNDYTNYSSAGLCPSLHLNLPSNISARSAVRLLNRGQNKNESEQLEFHIQEVKDKYGKVIYHTVRLGEYPKTKVSEDLSITLESLYHRGFTRDEIVATGRWYSNNGQKEDYKDYAGKHSPEFEYNGERYVRVVSYPNDSSSQYSDGTIIGKQDTVRWVKVEPISFVIRNWDDMPKEINPNGTGKADFFNLRAEEAITGNIPFYPYEDDPNSTMWQNSMVRGFFNGIDVRNITENGNTEFGANRGGNFTDGCNFLNEAFNLSREPMIEYTIPESETEIPDDAFNGCITLKKLIIHSGIKSVGKRAFEGLNFKFLYKLKTGELVFADSIPENRENILEVNELEKLAKAFIGFDYNILVQNSGLSEILELSEKLNKNKFSIPYIYATLLIQNGEASSFCENNGFRFFKSELPNINDRFLDFPEEERLDFFKFAEALGCFSTEKLLDKKGKETETLLAQKASSALAQLLKTEELKLRKISWNIRFDAIRSP